MEIRNFKKAVLRNQNYYFREGITWTWISSSYFGSRYSPKGFLFDVAGSTLFLEKDKILYFLGYMCSYVADYFLKIINPSLNFSNGVIAKLPIILANADNKVLIDELVEQNINISKKDWDSFETSWDFKKMCIRDR